LLCLHLHNSGALPPVRELLKRPSYVCPPNNFWAHWC